jgi:hypothetical protein
MARTTESAVQRLQVGLVGLLVVLLFVSLANMLIDRADSPEKTAAQTEAAKQGGDKAATDQPPVEIGVTPVMPEQPDAKAAQPAPATQN